jgi:hypothetical protein
MAGFVSVEAMRVLCLLRDQQQHVKPVEADFGDRAEFVYTDDWRPETVTKDAWDLVLCVNDYWWGVARCLDSARQAGIPTLVLQDGLLEWRCQYENPLFGAGGGAPQHQPVLSDKIACLGHQSARHVAAWGNRSKVEITGMPRLDYLHGRASPAPRRPGSRLLVMTAKKPGFTQDQADLIERSLRDVRNHLTGRRDVETIWRITGQLAEELGVPNELRSVGSEELVTILERVDAVITTPSTAMLEAMLVGRPVAALDYHNAPRFTPTAWTISAPEQIPGVIDGLLNPTPRRMAFQEASLHDSLSCETPAAPRVSRLIVDMVSLARKIRTENATWRFPPDMVGDPGQWSLPRPRPLKELYPEQPLFGEEELDGLRVRLARAQKENEWLQRELGRRALVETVSRIGRRIRDAVRKRTSR